MKTFRIPAIIFIAVSITSCLRNQPTNNSNPVDQLETIEIEKRDILVSEPLSKKEQADLKPDEVVKRLMKGNKNFVEDNLTVRNTTERVRKASIGQYPKAVILSCLDSRVPVEDVFHSGIGNLFVARVAGNIVNNDILGSMEYACKVSGAKVVFVLGHEYCGAIKSAIDGVKLGNITGLLDKIKPAVYKAVKSHEFGKTSKDAGFVEEVCEENVQQAIIEIRQGSPILKEMEDRKQILIVGGVYNMKTGKVSML
ncbi:carbonic anhydrase family protein [Pedobacter sp. MC2016-05]|uniref:carbonic anhydrase family protein n=1 Tax=Pedobacter sp. MC2016-05 TaxID=2994474 RepID=UPI002247DED0|nr:carbonic anhydrase family protein [Pedobacter sp. MC2016-05]MCX2477222.1 carbonic anhydrase family protein [Pedobacter sp. MC2016-05]